jgi:hypothetical protein
MSCTSTSSPPVVPLTRRARGGSSPERRARLRAALLSVLTAGVVLAGCSSPPSSSASTASHVTAAWTTFFKGSTSAAGRLALLQDPTAFAAAIRAQTSSSFAKGLSVKVSKVKVTSSTTATVTYSILIGGSPELPGAKGEAVLVGGHWKVSTQSFCSLLQLEGGAPPICSAH